MPFRRVVKHVQGRNWTAVGAELVIVVVGVFLGLQAQQWAEERARDRTEAAYTQRLHDEVVDLQATRRPIVEIRNRWNAGLGTATDVLFGEAGRDLSSEECLSVAFSYIVTNPTDDLASLMELQSSGGFTMFRQEAVSRALGSYLLARARTRDALLGIGSAMKPLASHYPELVRVRSASDVTTLTFGAYECDAAGMRDTQAFLNDYEMVQANFGLHVAATARVSESLAQLHDVLDATLGIVHEDAPS